MGLFLLFLGLSEAYRRHHDRLMLREGLMVAFFLAGLVVLGGQQRWWLQEVLSRLDETALFYGATALTAITDNAALTYLGSLVEGVSEEYKYALVAGAVAGGGLTVIANAPESGRVCHPQGQFRRAIDQSIRVVRGCIGADGRRRRLLPGDPRTGGRNCRLGPLGPVVRATRPFIPVPADPAVRGRGGRPVGGIWTRLERREVATWREMLMPNPPGRFPSAAGGRRRTAPTPRPPSSPRRREASPR